MDLKDFAWTVGACVTAVIVVGILFEVADDVPGIKQAKDGYS